MIGELTNVSVAGMLRLLAVHQQTGCLKVQGSDGEGELYLEQGVLVGTGAISRKVTDETLRLLLLRQGFFHFDALPAVPPGFRREQITDIENIILEASRRCPADMAQEFLPPGDAVMQLAPIHSSRPRLRLDFMREEWAFLILVNGENPLQYLMEKSNLPRERAVQVAYGLLASGLLRRTRFRLPEIMLIASRELGNMGEALVRQGFRNLGLDPSHMRAKELIALLNELERNATLLLGPSRASALVNQMWEKSKQ